MFLDFLPIKFSQLGAVNFNEKAEWSFADKICWQEHNHKKRYNLYFSCYFSKYYKKDKTKKWQEKQNNCAENALLGLNIIKKKSLLTTP